MQLGRKPGGLRKLVFRVVEVYHEFGRVQEKSGRSHLNLCNLKPFVLKGFRFRCGFLVQPPLGSLDEGVEPVNPMPVDVTSLVATDVLYVQLVRQAGDGGGEGGSGLVAHTWDYINRI